MLERTDQIEKGNMEDTGTARKTQKEKAFSALLRHMIWWWQTSYFQKKDEHLITYKSGDWCSTVDYIITRREKLKNIKDCKVIPGECAITQHRILVMDFKSSLKKDGKTDEKETAN